MYTILNIVFRFYLPSPHFFDIIIFKFDILYAGIRHIKYHNVGYTSILTCYIKGEPYELQQESYLCKT